ncbi:MAG TPA: type II CAAX endopeptidase family protein [Anaerolineales bacterium]|nr:type II CAAX endopeptidase family protein [Anaerolineales bacterium]
MRRLFYSPGEGRLRSGWRLLALFFLILLLSVVFSIPFTSILLQSPNRNTIFFLVNGVVGALTYTGSVYIARRWLDHRSFLNLGLRWRARAVQDLIAGVVMAGLMMAAIYALEWALGWLQFEAFAWQTQPVSQVVQASLLMLVAYVLTGWGEELLFRGYIMQNLISGLNEYWGVVLSAILFALVHLANPHPSIDAVIGLVLSGIFFAWAYLRTRLLWLPIGIHIGWNFFEGTVFGFPVSGTNPFMLLRQSVSGPEVITGGPFGPEAGLVLLLALLIGFLLIFAYTRNREASPGLLT